MPEIETTMTDVRKAYRLLAEYQQHILDVVQDIAKEFNYEFYRWESYHDVATDEKSRNISRTIGRACNKRSQKRNRN